jgi:hypothetical protein
MVCLTGVCTYIADIPTRKEEDEDVKLQEHVLLNTEILSRERVQCIVDAKKDALRCDKERARSAYSNKKYIHDTLLVHHTEKTTVLTTELGVLETKTTELNTLLKRTSDTKKRQEHTAKNLSEAKDMLACQTKLLLENEKRLHDTKDCIQKTMIVLHNAEEETYALTDIDKEERWEQAGLKLVHAISSQSIQAARWSLVFEDAKAKSAYLFVSLYDTQRKEMEKTVTDAISEWYAARHDTLDESSELKHARETVSAQQSTLEKLNQDTEELENEATSSQKNVSRLKERIWILEKEWSADTNAVSRCEEELSRAIVVVHHQERLCEEVRCTVADMETTIQSSSCELRRYGEALQKMEKSLVLFQTLVDEYEEVRREITTVSLFVFKEEAMNAEKMACTLFFMMTLHGDALTRGNIHRHVHEFVRFLQSGGRENTTSINILSTSEYRHRTPNDDGLPRTDINDVPSLVGGEKSMSVWTGTEVIPFLSGNDGNIVDIQCNVAMVKATSTYKRKRDEDLDCDISPKKERK